MRSSIGLVALQALLFVSYTLAADTSSSIIDAINQANGDGTSTSDQSFVNDVFDATQIILQNPTTYEHLIGKRIDDPTAGQPVQDLLASVSGFDIIIRTFVIPKADNRVKKLFYQDANKSISRVNVGAQALQSALGSKQNDWNAENAKDRQSLVEPIQAWGKKQTDDIGSDVSSDKKAQIEELVKNVIGNFTAEIDVCATKLGENFQAYKVRVKKSAKTYLTPIFGLVQQVQNCLNSNDDVSAKCRTNASGDLNSLNRAPAEFDRLTREARNTKIPSLNNACTQQVKAEYVFEKIHAEIDINKIKSSDSDGNNTDGNNTDGNNTDGNNTDGNNTDGNNTDGNNTDGNNTDGNNTDGN